MNPIFLICLLPALVAGAAQQPRARDLGIPVSGSPGPWNAITDVPGVLVGHVTLIAGEGPLVVGRGPVRSGVTAILPTGMNFRPVFAGWSTLNGNGEMTGTMWIEESGYLEEPILLTNTRGVGPVHDAAHAWRLERHFHAPDSGHAWAALPVVAETWDGRLNDIHGSHVRQEHVFQALDQAKSGPVPEGNVGGGTGMVCHRFKGGIGTSSRRVSDGYTVGVLVQANYGTREELTVAGVPVGREITDLLPVIHGLGPEGNSIIVVIATDAPLLPHQLKRLAKRATIGIGRTGGIGNNSSGDLFLAFSTARATNEGQLVRVPMLPNDLIDPFLAAVADATEEAILNALLAAETMTGINGNTVYELPHERLRQILQRYNRLRE